MAAALGLALSAALAPPCVGWAQPVVPSDPAWSGLTTFLEVAAERGVRTSTPQRLSVSALSPRDALLLVQPSAPLPVADLAAFLRKGGRLAIADDFGRGDQLLRAFGIERAEPDGVDRRRRLRGNPGLLVASSAGTHPLARGAETLVTNHPSVLRHAQLDPVYSLGSRRDAVVLTGVVGQGHLVAISDGSVLINNMLALRGNRAFARNLAGYLVGDGNGTLFVLGSEAGLTGSLLDADNPLLSLNAALARIAQLPLPRGAVVALSAVLAALLIIAAISSLPRRAAYARRLDHPECFAGFAGRVRRHVQRRANLASALLAFKLELEALLASRRATALQPRVAQRARSLIAEIEALQAGDGPTSPRVDARKFQEIVDAGRLILPDLRA